jgi:hypothetical protein
MEALMQLASQLGVTLPEMQAAIKTLDLEGLHQLEDLARQRARTMVDEKLKGLR